jgi:hypothetical protein
MGMLWLEREHPIQLGCSLRMRSSAQSARQRGPLPNEIPSGSRNLCHLVAIQLGKGGSREVHCTDCNCHHGVP